MPQYQLTEAALSKLKDTGLTYIEIEKRLNNSAIASLFENARTIRGVSVNDVDLVVSSLNSLKLPIKLLKAALVLDSATDFERLPPKARKRKPREGDGTTSVEPEHLASDSRAPAMLDIPYRRNDFFTGRERQLAEIQAKLGSPANRLLAISGLGGIGKTQLAVEYAYRSARLYPQVFWTDANSERSLADGYYAASMSIGLPVDYSDPLGVVAGFRRWMTKESGWLLILDNADHPRLLDRYLPNELRGCVLLTSRAQSFDRFGCTEVIALDTFTVEESRTFLLKRLGLATTLASDEEEAIAELADRLGGLALALEQAAAYIKETGIGFRRYFNHFLSVGIQLFATNPPEVGSYPTTVASTWYLNFREVAAVSPESIELLRSAAFLLSPSHAAVAPIPFAMFADHPEALSEPLAPRLRSRLLQSHDRIITLSEIIRPLTRFSLVRMERQQYSFLIHPLVLEVIRAFPDI